MMRNFARSLGLALIVVVMGVTTSHAQTSISVAVGSPGSQIDVSYFYQNLSSDGEWFQDPDPGLVLDALRHDRRLAALHGRQLGVHRLRLELGLQRAVRLGHLSLWPLVLRRPVRLGVGARHEWAPAWVAWRSNDDYVGWAPLPPGADWDDPRGLTFAYANTIRSDEWCFVAQANILDVNVNLQLASQSRNVTLFGQSRDATRYEVRGGHPADVGFDVTRVETRIGRPVARVTISDVDAPGAATASAQRRGQGRVFPAECPALGRRAGARARDHRPPERDRRRRSPAHARRAADPAR